MITFEYVRKTSARNQIVLDDVTFTAPAGQITAIFGSSGAGKTCLMQVASGLEPCDSGLVLVDGLDVSVASAPVLEEVRRTKLGVVFDHGNLLPSLSIRENLDLPAKVAGLKVSATRRAEIANLFGVGHLLSEYPNSVSQLDQQRATLAGFALGGRTVLVCDEPTAMLNRQDSAAVMALLRLCVRELGMSVLFLSSDPFEAAYGDLAYLLDYGTIRAEVHSPTPPAIFAALQSLREE